MKERNNIDFEGFFKEHRQEVPDNGFSRRVMHRLPQRANQLSRIWSAICLSIGLLLFWIYDGMLYLQIALTDFANAIFKTAIRDTDPTMWVIILGVAAGMGLYRLMSLAND